MQQKKKWKAWHKVVLGIIGVVFLLIIILIATTAPDNSGKFPSYKLASGQTITNSEWDGSVELVKGFLHNNLNDWNSYESIEWSKIAKVADSTTDSTGVYYIVRNKFRTKNEMGGTMIYNWVFKIDNAGNVSVITKD